jgi:hypothetical protein
VSGPAARARAPAASALAARRRAVAGPAAYDGGALSMRFAATFAVVSCLAAIVAAPAGAQIPAPAPIAIDAPQPGVAVFAQRLDPRRLTAVVELAGRGAPDAQLALSGACGRFSCEGMTFTDANGRWRTRMALTTPRGHRDVLVRIAYWPRQPGQAPTLVRVLLRRSAPAQPPAPPAPQPAGDAATGGALAGQRPALVMIGDSLALGTAVALAADLPDWDVKADARVGRPLAEGMDILSGATLPSEAAGARTLLAFSLYTNDPPVDVAALEAAVRASVARLGGRGCAIWATISRPAPRGRSYRPANARLVQLAADPQLAGRLLVVPWAEEVARHRGWKAHDHVHATAAGNLARARMYADAARACAA